MNLIDIDTHNITVSNHNNVSRTVLSDTKFFYKIFKTQQTNDFLYSIYRQKFKSNDFFCGRYLLRECSLQYFKERECLISFELGYFNTSIAPAFCDVIMHKDILVGYRTHKGSHEYSTQQFNKYVDLLVNQSLEKRIIIPDVTKENIVSVDNQLSIIDFSDAILEVPEKPNSKFYDILHFYLETSDMYYSQSIVKRLKL